MNSYSALFFNVKNSKSKIQRQKLQVGTLITLKFKSRYVISMHKYFLINIYWDPSSFDDHVMMDWVPTSVHFDLTQLQRNCYIRRPVEVDKPSFHSPTPDSLSQAVWVIVDDGTPEENRRREDTVVWLKRPDARPVPGVCPGGLEQSIGCVFWEYNILCYFVIYT